jgi:hypothetical protein
MSYQYAPLPKIKICANPDCGKEFTVARSTRNAKYCCQDCADKIRLAKARAYQANKRAGEHRNDTTTKRTRASRPRLAGSTIVSMYRQKTDWDKIVATCEKYKVSYGQAVALGIIE